MKKYKYVSGVTSVPGFAEASREELRVIIAIMESREPLSEGDVTSLAGVSAARAKGALAFWEAEGVICGLDDCVITEEYPERVRVGELFETESNTVAESIRDEGLKGLLEETAAMIEKPVLTDNEIKCIVGLVTQYRLTVDYILELAAYIRSKERLTVNKLRDRAIRLVDKGIDNTEALGVYMNENQDRHPCEIEFRRLLGIYERRLSAAEKEMFRKWADDFGYSAAIVGEAYNISALGTGKLSLSYMDKVLTSWHEAGCRTVEECLANHAVKAADTKVQVASRRTRTEPQKPRYGDFDINDAFSKALERSYSTEEKKD